MVTPALLTVEEAAEVLSLWVCCPIR